MNKYKERILYKKNRNEYYYLEKNYSRTGVPTLIVSPNFALVMTLVYIYDITEERIRWRRRYLCY